MGVFERYTDQSKLVIFFARNAAVKGGSELIDSGHLLLGLLAEKRNRANRVFHLRDLLPEETSRQRLLKKQPVVEGTLPLSLECKRVLAYTADEANLLEDGWIDTVHLVLGILREEECASDKRLREIGLQLEPSRQLVLDNKGSRPSRRDSLWWAILQPTPVGIAAQIACLLGIILGMVLLWK